MLECNGKPEAVERLLALVTYTERDHNAGKPNPVLAGLAPLVGEWRTVGRHPHLPKRTLHGKAQFDWIEGGAFLRMRTRMKDPEIPAGVAIIGSDDTRGEVFMLYFDERVVSRKYDVELRPDGLVWKRDDPKLAQRFTIAFADDRGSLTGRGEMARDGGPWEEDLHLDYHKE